jgi:thioredoxin-related protein
MHLLYIILKNSVPTPQKTHHISTTKTNQLLLFKETTAVYCENKKNTLWENAEFNNVKEGDTYSIC